MCVCVCVCVCVASKGSVIINTSQMDRPETKTVELC